MTNIWKNLVRISLSGQMIVVIKYILFASHFNHEKQLQRTESGSKTGLAVCLNAFQHQN
jgi:hypothetical protein